MNSSRLERLAPLTGALTAVLMLVGASSTSFDYLPSAERAVEIYSTNPGRVVTISYLGLISAFTLIWFTGSVYKALREHEGGSARLSMVAFGGGVATAVTYGIAYAVKVTAGTRAETAAGISPIAAVTLHDLSGILIGNLGAVTFAVFIAATAIVSIRAAMMPRWLRWASVVITIGLLSPVSYLFVAFAALWLIGLSVWLYAQGARIQGKANPAPGTA